MGWHLGGTPNGVAVFDMLMWPARTFGWAGVDLFFVLSGFLMGSIVFREWQQTGRFDSKRFLIRRALKLWPVFYLFLFAQLLFGDHPWQSYFFQNFFHLQNYLGSSQDHLWSLAVEEHFYLVLAVVAPFAFRRRIPLRIMMMILGSAMVVPLALRIVGASAGDTPVHLQTYSHYRVDGLAAGLLLGLVATFYPRIMDKLTRIRWVWAVGMLAAIVWLSLFTKQSFLGSTLGFTVTMLGSVCFLLLLYRASWVPRLATVLRPIGSLGVYSYSLYIWHIAAARLAGIVLGKLGIGLAPIAQTAMSYAAAICVAFVVTRLVEWPSLRVRNRFFPSQRPVGPQPQKLQAG
ncbi:peptidoglycan/LPS O-acetylase OafA/YrhL [Sinomonas sp. RB5]